MFVIRLCFYGFLSFPSLILGILLVLQMFDYATVKKYSQLPLFNETYTYPERSKEEKYLVLIAVESCNLAMVSTMLVLADFISDFDDVEVKFFHYGGAGSFKYEHLLHETNYDIIKLQPEWKTAEEIEHAYKVDRGEIYGDWISPENGRLRIKNELELYQELRPNLILTGFVLSAKLSAQIANIPYYITMPPIFVDLNQYLFRFFPTFPEKIKRFSNYYFNKLVIYIARKVSYQANHFKSVSIEYSVFPKIRNLLNLMEGDKTLITEVPEMSGWSQTELREIYGDEGYVFTGPLYAKLKRPTPSDLLEKIEEVKNSKKRILYFAMGSSGNQDVVVSIMKSLNDGFHRGDFESIGLVISPTLKLIQKFGTENKELVQSLDPRIYLSDPVLPAHEINEICDFGIIHGGQGTIQTALTSGLPFVGVPSSPEHHNNIQMVVKHGSAVLVTKSSATSDGEEVMKKLKYVMNNEEEFRENADRLKEIYLKYDAPKYIADLIFEEISK